MGPRLKCVLVFGRLLGSNGLKRLRSRRIERMEFGYCNVKVWKNTIVSNYHKDMRIRLR